MRSDEHMRIVNLTSLFIYIMTPEKETSPEYDIFFIKEIKESK